MTYCVLAFFAFLAFLFAFVLIGGKGEAEMRRERVPLYRDLDRFTQRIGAEFTSHEVMGYRNVVVTCTLAGHTCKVLLGYEDEDFRLQLIAEIPGLDPSEFGDQWYQRLIRYQKRDYGQRLYSTFEPGFVRSAGVASSLREAFSSELPRSLLALLFGVEEEGTQSKHCSLAVARGQIALGVRSPEADALARVQERLEALVALGRFPDGPAQRPSARVKSAGKVQVTVQAKQRCTYCHQPLAQSGVLRSCGACGVVLHAECLQEHGGCTTVGCRNRARTG